MKIICHLNVSSGIKLLRTGTKEEDVEKIKILCVNEKEQFHKNNFFVIIVLIITL